MKNIEKAKEIKPEYDVFSAAINQIKEILKCPECKSDDTNFINNHAEIKCNDCGHIRKTLK